MERKTINRIEKIIKAIFIIVWVVLVILQTVSIYMVVTNNYERVMNVEPTFSFNEETYEVYLLLPIEIENNGYFDITAISFTMYLSNATYSRNLSIEIPTIARGTTLNQTLNFTLLDNPLEIFEFETLIQSMDTISFQLSLTVLVFPITLQGSGDFQMEGLD